MTRMWFRVARRLGKNPVRGAASYFDRRELFNTSTYLWHDVEGRAFTSNQPVADEAPDGTGFGRSQAATLTLMAGDKGLGLRTS